MDKNPPLTPGNYYWIKREGRWEPAEYIGYYFGSHVFWVINPDSEQPYLGAIEWRDMPQAPEEA